MNIPSPTHGGSGVAGNDECCNRSPELRRCCRSVRRPGSPTFSTGFDCQSSTRRSVGIRIVTPLPPADSFFDPGTLVAWTEVRFWLRILNALARGSCRSGASTRLRLARVSVERGVVTPLCGESWLGSGRLPRSLDPLRWFSCLRVLFPPKAVAVKVNGA